MESIRLLVIDDEVMIRRTLRRKLEKEGYTVSEAERGDLARSLLSEERWDLVFLDINLPDVNGLDLLREIHEQEPELPVVMMTGSRAVEKVVDAMKHGAFDYLIKPFNLEEVVLTLRKALEITNLRREIKSYRASFEKDYGFDQVVGKSPQMRRILEISKTVARSEADTVLLLGESGTGKNLIAQAIHHNSVRASKPFMEVTCTALQETLLESELFGHERGAFTDARTSKKGLCELAHQGTLFLDEIGDMSLSTQAKLLGFLETRSFRRVGGTRNITVDLRIIAATNRSMETLIAERRFREDLYYRLNVLEIELPPLRERPEDIPVLANFFVQTFNDKLRKNVAGFEKDALSDMVEYPWPGNVRELRNAVERAMILTKNHRLGREDLPLKTRGMHHPINESQVVTLPDHGVSLESVVRSLVEQALAKTHGNQTRAARLLSISRDQLRYRMKQFEIS